jgi:hypothetical protein
MIQKFNRDSHKWEPYQPGPRTYPPLPSALREQLDRITPSSSNGIRYWPVQVVLKDGTKHPCVYFANAAEYIRNWGVWPSDDSAKREIQSEKVETISESDCRLPARLADEVYRAGESGMGYTVFEIVYKDGAKSAHVTGNAVDFVSFPAGRKPTDIATVILHAGREVRPLMQSPEYAWCLFS